jgi:hypothetical protein
LVSSKRELAAALTVCAFLAGVSLAPVARPATVATNHLSDGTWTVQGRAISGLRCGDWLVRLTNAQGRLSGVVSLARSTVALQNLALSPDGSFSGATRAGVVGTRQCEAIESPEGFQGTGSILPSKIISARRAAGLLSGKPRAAERAAPAL